MTRAELATVIEFLKPITWFAPMWAFVRAGIIAAFLAVQLVLMRRFLADPRGKAIWYNATGTKLYLFGMLIAAYRLRPILQGVV